MVKVRYTSDVDANCANCGSDMAQAIPATSAILDAMPLLPSA